MSIFFKYTIRILILTFMVAGLVYFGSCIYANVTAMNSNPYHIPDMNEARQSIKIVNTGLKYYSNDITDDGNIVIMHGYWDFIDGKYKFIKQDSPSMSRNDFGSIEIKDRF